MIKGTGYKTITAVIFLLACGLTAGAANVKTYPAASQLERRADRAFIRGDYDRSMKLNKQADGKLPAGALQKQKLELKMARLYILLQDPEQAIYYYEQVHNSADTLMTVDDVCSYIDALRRDGKARQAEVVARKYAFKSPYSRNQRYMNTLSALSNKQHYYGKGDSDYAMQLGENSGSLPEYWLGKWNGETFYAVSHSPIQDHLKIYYHRTQYYLLGDQKTPAPFRSIPPKLQSGPVAFSKDKTMMIATVIDYKSNDRIKDLSDNRGVFVSQLYYSAIDARKGGWSDPKPLFSYQKGWNYAHPSFFNNDKSLVFSSDRPGGYGGMDLYVCHWNETTRTWGDPVNLGPSVNTEGDEIYPLIIGDALFLSSNGHDGYGGYDIYRMSFGRNIVLPGSLFHYPYPINTSWNDFGVYFDDETGYFISDRRGAEGKDDIYTFDGSVSPLGSSSAIGVSAEYSAMAGNLNLITGLGKSNTQVFEKELIVTPVYTLPEEGELMLSVYFDFNSYHLDSKSIALLKELTADRGINGVKELSVIGYADELGSMEYNKALSEQRANAVAQFLTQNEIKPALSVEGRGKIHLSQTEYMEALNEQMANIRFPMNNNAEFSASQMPLEDRILINRKARRVDIGIKRK